jgi:hypothetical protein
VTLPRRSFLAILSAGLTGYAALTLQRSHRSETQPRTTRSNIDATPLPYPSPSSYNSVPWIRGGIVTSVNGGELRVQDGLTAPFTLRLRPDTVYDEGAWTGAIPIEVGDRVLARMGANGEAESVWTNIAKVEGEVLAVIGGPAAPFQLRMRNARDVLDNRQTWDAGHIVQVDPRTLIALFEEGNRGAPTPMTPAAARKIPVSPGDHWLVVGRRLPNDTVLAVSILPENV